MRLCDLAASCLPMESIIIRFPEDKSNFGLCMAAPEIASLGFDAEAVRVRVDDMAISCELLPPYTVVGPLSRMGRALLGWFGGSR